MSEERKFRPCCPNPFGCNGEDGCCTEPFTFAPTLEIRASRTKECEWDTCGFLDPSLGDGPFRIGCDKTYYSTQVTVSNYLNGSVETTTRNTFRDEYGLCKTSINVDCVRASDFIGCNGLSTSTTTYSNPITNPVLTPYYDEELGGFVGYGPCEPPETPPPYPPYRYQGGGSFWQDSCNTIPYPENNDPSWVFTTAAVNYDLTSNLCAFGFNARAETINLQYRIRHHAQGTCYLKVWIAISTQKYEKVVTDPEVYPCCESLQAIVPPTRQLVTYEWEGSGRPCYQEIIREDGSIDFTSCESEIFGTDFEEVTADENEVKTVRIWKWSFVKGYEPNNPDPPQEIKEMYGNSYQGRYPNGFPIWPIYEELENLSPATW